MRKGRAPARAPDTTTTTAWTRGCAAGFGRGNPAMCTHWHRSACRLFMRMMQASRASLGSRCRVGSEDGHAACARSSTGGCERADTVHRPAYLVHVDHDVGETAGCEVESGDRRDLDARASEARGRRGGQRLPAWRGSGARRAIICSLIYFACILVHLHCGVSLPPI